MKKTKLFGLAFIASMMSLSACSNDAEEVLTQENEIKLTSEITPSRVTSLNYQSTQIVEGQQVGVTITGAKSEHNNVAWSVGEDGALSNTGDEIYYGNGTATITAYHPFNDDWDENTSYAFTVSTDQSVEANYLASDLLWDTASSSKTEEAVSLTFAHKLAKINVTLTPEYEGTDLSGATISICNTKPSTTFNPTDGSISAANSVAQEIKAGVTTSSAYTASAIVIPQTVASGTKFIKVVLGEKTFYYTLSADKVLKSGYSHNYTLTVKEQKVEVKGESEITDWTEEEVTTGDAEEEAMNAVDLGLSVKWANCNIGANNPHEYGDYFAWGETAPKSSYDYSNMLILDKIQEGLKSTGVVDSNGNLTAAYDAATVNWGGNWRMPTRAEIEEILNNCTWTWTTQNDTKGYLVCSKTNGNSIFLPAAGFRQDTSLGGSNEGASYWSSTYDWDIFAFNLQFNNNGIDTPYKGCNSSFDCSMGFLVRPVTE